MFKNRGKKKFYKRECALIDEKIWRQELRIVTIEKIREGIRMEYDRINGAVKQQEESFAKMVAHHKFSKETLKVLEIDIPRMEEQSMAQWIETKHQHRMTNWKKEMDNLLEVCQNDKEVKKALTKAGVEILDAYEIILRYKQDAENMREQMVGKYSEREKAHIGGIDQEVRQIESNISGGEEFRHLIEEERKKL